MYGEGRRSWQRELRSGSSVKDNYLKGVKPVKNQNCRMEPDDTGMVDLFNPRMATIGGKLCITIPTKINRV